MFGYEKMIAVTDRHVFDTYEDPEAAFLRQLEKVAALGPRAIVLREKDLDRGEYLILAKKAVQCPGVRDLLIPHLYPEAALELGIRRIHLPLQVLAALRGSRPEILREISVIGTSVHSAADAKRAVELGASYLFAGNVYETACKPGLEGKGLSYLRDVAESVPVPVYGIGGISEDKMPELLAAGAAGGCMMSGFMKMQTKAESG